MADGMTGPREAEDPIPPTIEWRDGPAAPGTAAGTTGRVRMIDQRRLPGALEFLEVATVDELCVAIRTMAVRGAPALGVAGAMGIALASCTGEPAAEASAKILATRPTAVNLAWGVERGLAAADPVAEARRVAADDVTRNRRLGAVGASLIHQGGRVFTHCNAGALACAGYGTALGVVRAAHEQGLRPSVWVGETRPALQGSRLTAWELDRLGIPSTLVADVAAASLMASGQVDCVVVGADRIAANGDVANKVGTLGLALIAHHHGIPFYVAAPVSTVDLNCPTGTDIPIERRAPEEITVLAGTRIAPPGFPAENAAFDITPAALVTAIITDAGLSHRPHAAALPGLVNRGSNSGAPD